MALPHKTRWRRIAVKLANIDLFTGIAKRLVRLGLPPHTGLWPLSKIDPKGFVSHRARLAHPDIQMGNHCFIGDEVLILREGGDGRVELGDRVHIHEYNTVQSGDGGSLFIGSDTHIQPRCQFSAYKGDIRIGQMVEIAPGCAFYPYNHGLDPATPIQAQPLSTNGGITIEDEAWLGYGAIILDGVTIGKGAVVAAGAVVTRSVAPNSIVAGSPAREIGKRQ